jgi:hypothetical protein
MHVGNDHEQVTSDHVCRPPVFIALGWRALMGATMLASACITVRYVRPAVTEVLPNRT